MESIVSVWQFLGKDGYSTYPDGMSSKIGARTNMLSECDYCYSYPPDMWSYTDDCDSYPAMWSYEDDMWSYGYDSGQYQAKNGNGAGTASGSGYARTSYYDDKDEVAYQDIPGGEETDHFWGSGNCGCGDRSEIDDSWYGYEDYIDDLSSGIESINDCRMGWVIADDYLFRDYFESILFEDINDNVAMGHLIGRDQTTHPCCVIKKSNDFYIGGNRKIAEGIALLKKLHHEDADVKERIKIFVKIFPRYRFEGYWVRDLWICHYYLTGSPCDNILGADDINFNDDITLLDFFNLARDDNGWEEIDQLEREYTRSKGYISLDVPFMGV